MQQKLKLEKKKSCIKCSQAIKSYEVLLEHFKVRASFQLCQFTYRSSYCDIALFDYDRKSNGLLNGRNSIFKAVVQLFLFV